MDYQKLIVAGTCTKDCEMRYTPSGTAVATFGMAVNKEYKGADGQKVKEVMWVQVATFKGLAEMCAQYVKKGGEILVEGKLSPDPKTGNPKMFERHDGTSGTSYEMIADVVRLGRSRQDGQSRESAKTEDDQEF